MPGSRNAARITGRGRPQTNASPTTNLREARALVAAAEADEVHKSLALLAAGDEVSVDLPELDAHLASLDDLPADNTEPPNAEVFAGIAASVGLQSRGQHDHKNFDNVAELYAAINDGDNDSQGIFGDFA